MLASNSAFLRIKIVEYQLPKDAPAIEGEPHIAVNLKEKEMAEDGTLAYVQKKKTFYPGIDRCFDSHLHEGRLMQVLITELPDKVVCQLNVELETLADHYRSDPTGNAVKLAIDLNPSGSIVIQVKIYGEESRESASAAETQIQLEANIAHTMPKHATALRPRRGGLKVGKTNEVKGHLFVKKFFRQPAYCSLCHELMWGFGKEGYQCKECMYTAHGKCVELILNKCMKAPANSQATIYLKERFKLDVPHRFLVHSFRGPTFCELCGQILWGIFRQGMQCESCGVNCHKKCQKQMPHLCGVNEKLLSEALLSIKSQKPSKAAEPLPALPDYVEVEKFPPRPSIPLPQIPSPSISSDAPAKSVRSGKSAPTPTAPQDKGLPKFTLDDFEIKKVIGKGSFGKVLLVLLKGTNQFFALKALKKDSVLEDDDVECTLIEKRALALGSACVFLTHLHSTFQSPSHLFFTMEFLNGGDLMFHIQNSTRFTEERTRFYTAEITVALQYLHSKGIAYRDLKLDNVLLTSEGHVKIADFGMCKENIGPNTLTTTFCGTPDYIAPEIINGKSYGISVDWWSFGVLCYEMLIGQSPFQGEDEDDLFQSICNDPIDYPRWLTKDAINLVDKLLQREPDFRIGCIEHVEPLRNHPFFRTINWDKLINLQIEPPFKPKVRSMNDICNFDADFTSEQPELTPPDAKILQTMDQSHFDGFSFTNNQFILPH